jgi:hypothetical protein
MAIKIVPTHQMTLLTSDEPITGSGLSVPSLDLTSLTPPVSFVLLFTEHDQATAASARLRLIDRYSHMRPIDHSFYVHHVPSEPDD